MLLTIWQDIDCTDSDFFFTVQYTDSDFFLLRAYTDSEFFLDEV